MFFVVEPFRVFDEDVRGQLDVFGIAAVAFQPDIAAAVLAQRLQIGEAVTAMTAIEIEIGGDAVADFESRYAGTDVDDFARDLMADDARKFYFAPAGFGVLDSLAPIRR